MIYYCWFVIFNFNCTFFSLFIRFSIYHTICDRFFICFFFFLIIWAQMFSTENLHHLLSVIFHGISFWNCACIWKFYSLIYVSTMLKCIVLYPMESSEFIWQIFVGYIFQIHGVVISWIIANFLYLKTKTSWKRDIGAVSEHIYVVKMLFIH